MNYEIGADPGRAPTLADNLQRGHRVASEIEQCLLSIDGVLTGCGQTGNSIGATSPSSGLLGDACSLADRLERIMSAVHVLAGAISAAPNVADFHDIASKQAAAMQQGYAGSLGRAHGDIRGY